MLAFPPRRPETRRLRRAAAGGSRGAGVEEGPDWRRRHRRSLLRLRADAPRPRRDRPRGVRPHGRPRLHGHRRLRRWSATATAAPKHFTNPGYELYRSYVDEFKLPFVYSGARSATAPVGRTSGAYRRSIRGSRSTRDVTSMTTPPSRVLRRARSSSSAAACRVQSVSRTRRSSSCVAWRSSRQRCTGFVGGTEAARCVCRASVS